MKISPDAEGAKGAGGLTQLFWKKQGPKPTKDPRLPKKPEQSFEDELQQEKARDESASSSSKRASAPSARTLPLEALLVSHATSPRPAAVIDTKKQNVKAAPKAEADAVAARAKAHPTTTQPAGAKLHELSKPREGKAASGERAQPDKKHDDFKLEAPQRPAESQATAATQARAPQGLPTDAAQPMVSANPVRDAAPLAPVAPLMLEDASVRAVLLPTVARVSLEAGEAGRLNVQLKVNDGVTEIRATGPAAQLLEARQGELRVALAKEGLALGHFDLTQGHQHQQRPDAPDEQAAPLARKHAAATTSSSSIDSTVTSDGRLHVKA